MDLFIYIFMLSKRDFHLIQTQCLTANMLQLTNQEVSKQRVKYFHCYMKFESKIF